jgi:hypothetical protein
MKRFSLLAASAGLAICCVTSAFAAPSYENLDAAQQLIDQSSAHIEAARNNRHGEFGGHADRALQLLQQAKAELREAAAYNEKRH